MEKQTFLTFEICTEQYAVNVTKVLEVLEQQHITPVPRAPQFILGIINFRGEILPVINTRQKFNVPFEAEDLKHFVIVFETFANNEKQLVAATADSVKDVIEIDTSDIKPVPEMGLGYNTAFISGVVRHNERFVLLIEPDHVFSMNDKVAIMVAENEIQ